jgi:hypothetical protein
MKENTLDIQTMIHTAAVETSLNLIGKETIQGHRADTVPADLKTLEKAAIILTPQDTIEGIEITIAVGNFISFWILETQSAPL